MMSPAMPGCRLQYRVTTKRETVRHAFGVESTGFLGWRQSIRVAPGGTGPVVLGEDALSDRWRVAQMTWGLRASDGGDHCLRVGSDVERWRWIVEDPELRCLVMASEFSLSPATGEAPSVRFGLPAADMFAFAGVWTPPGRNERSGFAILTCEPNASLAANAVAEMPVVLDRKDHALWLGGKLSDPWFLLRPNPAVEQL